MDNNSPIVKQINYEMENLRHIRYSMFYDNWTWLLTKWEIMGFFSEFGDMS